MITHDQLKIQVQQCQTKFLIALNNLWLKQQTKYQNESLVYPFILQIDNYQFLIHLGKDGKYSQTQNVQKLFQLKNQFLNSLLQQQIKQEFLKEEDYEHKQSDPFYNTKTYKITKLDRKRKEQKEKVQDLLKGIDQKSTKNIPKNYAKAIINYILQQDKVISTLFNDEVHLIEVFKNMLKERKLKLQNIKQFSYMMTNDVEDIQQQKLNKIFRILTYRFLTKDAIPYIFNSRIVQKSWHIKYRNDILRAVKNPQDFTKVQFKTKNQ